MGTNLTRLETIKKGEIVNKVLKLSAVALLSAAVLFGGSVSPVQAATCVKVANVVGKNYQTAQDIWRAQGFSVSPAKDGLGLGRLSWKDKNWKVTAQSPKAGTCVKKKSSVRATIVKYTD